MTFAENLLIITSVLTFATMAGVYFSFSIFVMRALNTLPDHEATAAMNAINRVILTSWFMPLFFGSSLLAVLCIWSGVANSATPLQGALLAAAGISYVLGMLGVTMLFNVPLNTRLAKSGLTESVGKEAISWSDYYRDWLTFNHIRLASCVAATIVLLISLL